MSKPTTLPEWASGASAAVTEPTLAQKQAGWAVRQKPPAQYLNWWKKTVYQWIQYLNNITAEALAWTVKQVFGAGLDVTGGDVSMTAASVQRFVKTAAGALQLGTTTAQEVQFLVNNAVAAKLSTAGELDASTHKMKGVVSPALSDTGDYVAPKAYVERRIGELCLANFKVTPLGSNTLNCIRAPINGGTYLSSPWVIVGNAGTIYKSTDYTYSWTAVSGATAHLYGVEYFNVGGPWCIVGAGGVIYTYDGNTTLTLRTSNTTQDLYHVCSNRSLYVAVGAAGTILSSSDGITWTQRGAGLTTAPLRGVAWNGSMWCIVGDGVVLTSTDGLSWTLRSTSVWGPSVTWGNGMWVSCGGYKSTDGITWTSVGASLGSSPKDVIWTGQHFLVGSTTSGHTVSYDGSEWRRFNTDVGLRTSLNSIDHDGPFIVGVGATHTYIVGGVPQVGPPAVTTFLQVF